MKTHITKGSILDDLGFEASEAEDLKIRATLMRTIEAEIKRQKLTQTEAAKILEITQPQLSNLKQGKIHLFTIDCLVTMLSHLELSTDLVIARSALSA